MYLHCHNCDWSQDDFWTLRYNPITKIWQDIKDFAYPHVIELDDWIVEDLVEITGVWLIRLRPGRRGQTRVFSWSWLWLEIRKELQIVWRQKWWTWGSWQRTKKTAICPKCKQRGLDID